MIDLFIYIKIFTSNQFNEVKVSDQYANASTTIDIVSLCNNIVD